MSPQGWKRDIKRPFTVSSKDIEPIPVQTGSAIRKFDKRRKKRATLNSIAYKIEREQEGGKRIIIIIKGARRT